MYPKNYTFFISTFRDASYLSIPKRDLHQKHLWPGGTAA